MRLGGTVFRAKAVLFFAASLTADADDDAAAAAAANDGTAAGRRPAPSGAQHRGPLPQDGTHRPAAIADVMQPSLALISLAIVLRARPDQPQYKRQKVVLIFLGLGIMVGAAVAIAIAVGESTYDWHSPRRAPAAALNRGRCFAPHRRLQTDWPEPAGALFSLEDAFDPANQPKTETVRWITDGAAPLRPAAGKCAQC